MTITIKLTKGYEAIIDDEDGDLAHMKWCTKTSKGNTVYALHRVNRKPEYLHRVILERILGRSLRKGEEVDHIDRNGCNNRRANLRLATRSQNARNTKWKAGASGFKGVRRHGRGWCAEITVNYKIKYLGTFDTPEEAHQAYVQASKKYHGEFGRTE